MFSSIKCKRALFIIAGLVTALVINSCKKTSISSIQQLFTGGTWELASFQTIYYTGNQADSTVTDSSTCLNSQFFTFNTNNTCTYTNFDCITQTSAAATWSLTGNQLFLQTSVVCKDTTKAGTSTPFAYAQIMNLGIYSLVLNTGDIQPNYSLTAKRKVFVYGFIRQKGTTP
ncbi:lipocalin family protein [Mucilaginibacter sp.]|uniref:lipocalin family protein n=1 Tax=Mucilaginibacter sp. TaxID=1882438 RepID=UPI00284DD3D5|nr:lipocalin family protein [Mucilaginibacter sp.]MDR3694362.1 lipocalin family protein [Mucilaginibacter sp.]